MFLSCVVIPWKQMWYEQALLKEAMAGNKETPETSIRFVPSFDF